MNEIAIFGNKFELQTPETLVLYDAFRRNKIDVEKVDADRFKFVIGEPQIYYNNKEWVPKKTLVRMGAAATQFDLALLRHMEFNGVSLINNSGSIFLASNKLVAYQLMQKVGIPIPKTVVLNYPIDYNIIDTKLGYPLIVKRLNGSFGNGVYLCKNRDDLYSFLGFLDSVGVRETLLLQECMKHLGQDVRVIVVKDYVCQPVHRTGLGAEYRSNLTRPERVDRFSYEATSGHGIAKSYPKSPGLLDIVQNVQRLFRLDVMGIDLLFSDKGFVVGEVNPNPGFDGFENLEDLDAIVKML